MIFRSKHCYLPFNNGMKKSSTLGSSVCLLLAPTGRLRCKLERFRYPPNFLCSQHDACFHIFLHHLCVSLTQFPSDLNSRLSDGRVGRLWLLELALFFLYLGLHG